MQKNLEIVKCYSIVKKIADNGYQIVIQTRPETANTVAKFIDDHGFDQILGSVAGDDTIIIVPADVASIRQTVREITSPYEADRYF